jgi:hypothetical protein
VLEADSGRGRSSGVHWLYFVSTAVGVSRGNIGIERVGVFISIIKMPNSRKGY